MTRHELKTWPEPFQATGTGIKKFELRKNDRDFQIGDELCLREWSPEKGYSGRYILSKVTWILKSGFGLPRGYCIMSIQNKGANW